MSDGFERVANVADVPENGLLGVVKANGDQICLIRQNGEIHAVSNVCTHQEFQMCDGTIHSGNEIECIWHGSRFDFVTGDVLTPPAYEPLPIYAVRVADGEVFVGGLKP